MTSEIFEETVCELFLFVDNVPCHPPFPTDYLSNIKLSFCQKIRRLEVKQWKEKTKRMCAVKLMKKAWDEISEETIKRCFVKGRLQSLLRMRDRFVMRSLLITSFQSHGVNENTRGRLNRCLLYCKE